MSNPVISVRKTTDPSTIEGSLNFGYIAADQVGFPASITIYNNYEAYAAVEAAYEFKVCSYDNQAKTAETDPVKDKWLEVRQVSYNGLPVNSEWTAIGGDVKYSLPYNNGIINGGDGARGAHTVLEFRVATPHRLDIAKKWTPFICFEYSNTAPVM